MHPALRFVEIAQLQTALEEMGCEVDHDEDGGPGFHRCISSYTFSDLWLQTRFDLWPGRAAEIHLMPSPPTARMVLPARIKLRPDKNVSWHIPNHIDSDFRTMQSQSRTIRALAKERHDNGQSVSIARLIELIREHTTTETGA